MMVGRTSDQSPKKHIRFKILLYMGVRNLVYKKLRTTLTAMGVVIGIGAITFLVSLALGLRNTVNQQVVGSESIKTIDVTSPDATTIHLNDSNLAKFSKFSHVTDIAKTYIVPGRLSINNSNSDAVTYAVDDKYLKLVAPNIVSGSATVSTAKPSNAVVNLALLKTIGISDSHKAIGKKFQLQAKLDQVGSTGTNPSTSLVINGVIDAGSGPVVYTSDGFIQSLGSIDYTQTKVVVDSEKDVNAVRKQIESLGFVTQSPVDTVDQINHLFSIFAYILAGFGGIGMLIAILGMFNTLTISLLERTSEIGLLIAIGARSKDVKRLFMAEALSLSFAGGIGGVVGAWTLGTIINLVLSNVAHSRGLKGNIDLFSVPAFLGGILIVFVLLVGYLVVLLPAKRAARINPIDALRHE